MRRWLLIGGGVVAAVVLFILLRPGDDEQNPPTTQAKTQAGNSVTLSVSKSPRVPTVIRIVVRGGSVAGGPKVHEATKGDRVVLVVRSNVADEVHIHGYNLKRNVPAGGTARIAFRARLAGRFEMELEEHRLPLGELEVLP